jgi:hypothetical protein
MDERVQMREWVRIWKQAGPELERTSASIKASRPVPRLVSLNSNTGSASTANRQEVISAAQPIQEFCLERQWRFCFISARGHRWGEARATRDAVLTLLTGFGGEQDFARTLLETFRGPISNRWNSPSKIGYCYSLMIIKCPLMSPSRVPMQRNRHQARHGAIPCRTFPSLPAPPKTC